MADARPSPGELARRGFLDTARAVRFLDSPVLAAIPSAALLGPLSTTAEPDVALLALVRLGEGGCDLASLANGEPERWARLVRVLGASRWAGDQIVADPSLVEALTAPEIDQPFWKVYERVAELVGPYLGNGGDLVGGTTALRRFYRREMLSILSADLELSEPGMDAARAAMPRVAAAISRLVGASLDGALRIARALHPEADGYPFSVVSMGKTGGEELNYISD
ncbi:MAG: hypothetical protein Q4G64_06950, partial [bacterium]|nr:hypothetical protein [bacterium]